MSKPQLFETEKKERWTGSKALVLLDATVCPLCSGPLEEMETHQDALLRHGGYGATRRTVHLTCVPCRWGYDREVQEVRPPR